MKLFVDDIRNPPDDSWIVVREAEKAIRLINTGKISVISLDHDLGENVQTGYDVANHLEKACLLKQIPVPTMLCHSANPPGKANIERCFQAIKKWEQTQKD